MTTTGYGATPTRCLSTSDLVNSLRYPEVAAKLMSLHPHLKRVQEIIWDSANMTDHQDDIINALSDSA